MFGFGEQGAKDARLLAVVGSGQKRVAASLLVGQAGGFSFAGGLFLGLANLLVLLGFSFNQMVVPPDGLAAIEHFSGDKKARGDLR
ncbi:MAG: hypothetical protein IPL05_08840 [Betaproteobacteria bacterium]|nr:hypothetical protein [Betaproteobacteria bacterium]